MKRGSAILIALLFMAVASTIILGVGKIALNEIRNAISADETVSAFYAAEAGIEHAMIELNRNQNFIISPNQPLRVNLGDPNSPQNKYYDLEVTNRATTGNPNEVSDYIYRDETKEYDVTGQGNLLLEWDLDRGTNLAKCDRRSVAGENFVDLANYFNLIEWRLFNEGDEVANDPRQQLIKTGLNSLAFRGHDIHTALTQHSVQIPISSVAGPVKLRLRLFVVNQNFRSFPTDIDRTSPDQDYNCRTDFKLSGSTAIDQGETTILSTGYYGRTKRTLKYDISNADRRVLSIFDYSIFVGEGELK